MRRTSYNKWFKTLSISVAIAIILSFTLAVGYYYNIFSCEVENSASKTWVINTIYNKYYKDVGEIDSSLSIDEIVDTYLDIYSAYYTAEEYESVLLSNSGSRSGIGISMMADDDGVLVVSVLGNSPAYRSGLRTGMVLETLTTADVTLSLTTPSEISSFVSALSDDTEITFTTTDGENFSMYKAEYTTSYAFLQTNECGYSIYYDDNNATVVKSEGDAISYLPNGSAKLKLLQFYGNASTEIGMLLNVFNELSCDTLYLDLRSNGGGYVSVMASISAYFVESGVAMTAKYRGGTTSTTNISSKSVNANTEGVKVYVLANQNSASASEALIGVLISYEIIDYCDIFISNYSDDYIEKYGDSSKNGKTYGKGIMQETVTNSRTGEALKLTTAEIFWPNGRSIHDVGLTKDDGCVLIDCDNVVTRYDYEFMKVVNLTN